MDLEVATPSAQPGMTPEDVGPTIDAMWRDGYAGLTSLLQHASRPQQLGNLPQQVACTLAES